MFANPHAETGLAQSVQQYWNWPQVLLQKVGIFHFVLQILLPSVGIYKTIERDEKLFMFIKDRFEFSDVKHSQQQISFTRMQVNLLKFRTQQIYCVLQWYASRNLPLGRMKYFTFVMNALHHLVGLFQRL